MKLLKISCCTRGAGDVFAAMWAVQAARDAGWRVEFYTFAGAAQDVARLFLPAENVHDVERQKWELFLPHEGNNVATMGTARTRWFHSRLPGSICGETPVMPRPVPEVVRNEDFAGKTLLFPFSFYSEREWPLPRFIQTAKLLELQGHDCLIVGPENRLGLVRALGWQKCCNFAAWLPLSCAMLAVRMVVGNDSGPMNAAGSLGVPCVAIHAQMSAKGLTADYPTVRSVVPSWEGTCAGCHWQGFAGYLQGHCVRGVCRELELISPKSVVAAVNSFSQTSGKTV